MSGAGMIEMTAQELVAAIMSLGGQRKLVMLVGVPASGKSTVGDAFEKAGFRRVSMDLVRAELYKDAGVQGSGKAVGRRYRELLAEALSDGVNILVDNTNFISGMRHDTLTQAREAGLTDIHLLVMDVPLAECLRRNELRSRRVPVEKIVGMHRELTQKSWPRRTEGALTFLSPGSVAGRFTVRGFVRRLTRQKEGR